MNIRAAISRGIADRRVACLSVPRLAACALLSLCAIGTAAYAQQPAQPFVDRPVPAQSTKPVPPAPAGQTRANEAGANTADALQNLDRSLTDLDTIRDRYIDRAGNKNCPPAIISRMADLKWKLGQKGVVVSNPRGNASAPTDFVAIGQDWFKAGDAPVLEVRQPGIEDILPAGLISSQRKQNGSRADDEDVNKMQAEYEALSAACSGPQQPAQRPGGER